MDKRILAVVVVAVLIIGVLAGLVFLFGGIPGISIGEPLTITGDTELEGMGYSGNGTASNPYIIEGLNIAPNVLDNVDCITIQDTTKFIIIRSCVLSTSMDAEGIYLVNVENVVVEDCTINRGNYGICVWESNNVNITDNQISNCDWGIGVFTCTNYLVENNTFTNCFAETVIQD